jgi:hypothetical protein
MDISKKEIAEVSAAIENATTDHVRELDQLQLALVAGGYGETIL